MNNNREFTRSTLKIAAVLSPENGEDISGEVDNVSLYGLFLNTAGQANLQEKEPVQMTINLSGENTELRIDCRASIAHVKDTGIGVHIENLSVDAFLHWKNIVTYASGDSEKIEEEFKNYIRKHLSGKEQPDS